jgi:hypothetical protein
MSTAMRAPLAWLILSLVLTLAAPGAARAGGASAIAAPHSGHLVAPRPRTVSISRPRKTGRLRRFAAQASARVKLLALRAATLPAHVWPFNRAARALAHGEPLTGLTPKTAVAVAAQNARRGRGTVIGRLAASLQDPWSIRGAERSYGKLIDEIGRARAEDPSLDASIAFDPYSFGYELAGAPEHERRRTAIDGMLRVARRAKERGVGIEVDMAQVEGMEMTLEAASRIASELRVPVRLAIPARYRESEHALEAWAALARKTGVKLGVRLVKGSFVESGARSAFQTRRALLGHYKRMITLAMQHGAELDIAVATQNEEIFRHAEAESHRLGVPYSVHVIRGVNPAVQAAMGDRISREYVSYGIDGAGFGLQELMSNWIERRRLARRGLDDID